MTFIPRRYEQILPDMIARVVTRTPLSDVVDTASYYHMLAATAREDDEAYAQLENLKSGFSIDNATGDDLDERAAEIQPGTIFRIKSRKAVGEVVFSRVGVIGTVNIPIGTRVKTTDGIVFITTSSGVISAISPEQISGHGIGRDSSPVPVVAVLPGVSGNVVDSSIKRFDGKPSGVDEVINVDPTTLGRDREEDDAFKQRIRAFVASLARSTIQALESGSLGVEDPTTGATVLFSKAVEDIVNLGKVYLYVDDGTGSIETVDSVTGENVTLGLAGPPPDSAVGGEVRLFVDNNPVKEPIGITLTSSIRGALTENTDFTFNYAAGQIVFDPALVASEEITADYTFYTGLIDLVQKVIDGDPADRTNYPGIRAGGVMVQVLPPQVLIQTVTATLVVKEGYDQADAIISVKNAVITYINSLGISDDVILSEIIARIKGVPAIYDTAVSAPANNITILDNQLARTTSLNVTIS